MNMIQDKIVCIRGLSYSRALLLKVRLEMEGISCFLTHLDYAEGGVDINISQEDAEKAYLIIEEMKNTSGPEKEIVVRNLKSVRRILVPIDFSQLSIKAAHYALELARSLKADIRLLNVWFNNANENFVFNEMFAFQANLDTIMKELEMEAFTKMEEVVYELKKRIRDEKIKGVEIEYDLVRGAAVDAILDIVDEYSPGMVVMGTRGKNREDFGLIGSTTAKLIEKCKVPILGVPFGYNSSDFIAPKNVAYITNFDDVDFYALHRLIAFLRPFNVKLYCVHVHSADEFSLDKVKMKKLRNYFDDTFAHLDIECGLIENEDIKNGIEAFTLDKKIDLIALISHKRNLLSQIFKPSITRKLLFQTDIPILVFRESGNAMWKPRFSN